MSHEPEADWTVLQTAVWLPFLSDTDAGVVIEVWVVPGASRDEVSGVHDGALRIRTSAPPEGGRANRAVARLLARHLGVRRAEVVFGHSDRRKRVLVPRLTVADAEQRLAEFG
jgi:uncharacterized protein (TIGR00251 family)